MKVEFRPHSITRLDGTRYDSTVVTLTKSDVYFLLTVLKRNPQHGVAFSANEDSTLFLHVEGQ